MKTKIFKTISGEIIPEQSRNEPNNRLSFSDKFFAKILINDIEKDSIVCYDFKRERWTSPTSTNMQKVIEYYVEDLAFEKWINTNVLKFDLDTMLELFNAMEKRMNKTTNK